MSGDLPPDHVLREAQKFIESNLADLCKDVEAMEAGGGQGEKFSDLQTALANYMRLTRHNAKGVAIGLINAEARRFVAANSWQ